MWTKSPEHFKRLPEEERAAIEMMRGELRLKASEYPTEYVRLKDKSRDKKFKKDAELSLKFLYKRFPISHQEPINDINSMNSSPFIKVLGLRQVQSENGWL